MSANRHYLTTKRHPVFCHRHNFLVYRHSLFQYIDTVYFSIQTQSILVYTCLYYLGSMRFLLSNVFFRLQYLIYADFMVDIQSTMNFVCPACQKRKQILKRQSNTIVLGSQNRNYRRYHYENLSGASLRSTDPALKRISKSEKKMCSSR